MTEAFNPLDTSKLTPEQQARWDAWVEAGLDLEKTWFVMGVSDTLATELAQGRLPSASVHQMPALRDAVSTGQVNYAHPILTERNVSARRRLLSIVMDGNIMPDLDSEGLDMFRLIDQAKAYALISAVTAAAEAEFGVSDLNFATVLELAMTCAVEQYRDFINDTDEFHAYVDESKMSEDERKGSDQQVNADRDKVVEIVGKFSSDEVGQKLEKVFEHRGMLVFLQGNVFDHAQVIRDPEEDVALAIITKNGLPVDCICGVQVM